MTLKPGRPRSTLGILAVTMALAIAASYANADEAKVIPAPSVDEVAAAGEGTEVIVLAGGCFWGVQGVFQHVQGVTSAVSGYAGGDRNSANYERVSSGTTGHAEAVRVTFDPKRVSLGRLLQVYFSVAHDPTQLNRQGPDRGTQYRSAIFTSNARQASIAKAYISQLNAARVFDAAIVTRLETGRPFYRAESYHQDYLTRHPTNLYIVIHDRPKISQLQKLFPDLFRPDPMLVASAG